MGQKDSRSSASIRARPVQQAARLLPLPHPPQPPLCRNIEPPPAPAPSVLQLIGNGELVHVSADDHGGGELSADEDVPAARSASDYSYLADRDPGLAEMGKKLCEDEVQCMLGFCVHFFDPTSPEQHDAVCKWLRACLLAVDDPPTAQFAAALTPVSAAHSEVNMVLDKVSAHCIIHAEHGNGLNNLEQELLDGFVPTTAAGTSAYPDRTTYYGTSASADTMDDPQVYLMDYRVRRLQELPHGAEHSTPWISPMMTPCIPVSLSE
ncbi:hypothetical protein OBBRIDRAFT_808816 [Obba rivulosa]|uniref:Uncharacterized protein n=1 Tax=Obba rivulosa TaxID=1052685 RepID=A0A8E2AR59_9APHY|nr:hypothetical protein OBBRIDRAFT_808816 [Obba rivulosa]